MSGQSLEITQYFLTQNDCYKAGRTIVPKGIMVHSTGANNPRLGRYIGPDDGLLGRNLYNNHWNQSGLAVCVHAFIGKLADGSLAIYQTLPWGHRGWHAGRGVNGSANDTHISFEICEDDRTGAEYFKGVYALAVDLVASLCKEYDLDPLAPGVVIDHVEGYQRGIASNHSDVGHWFPLHGRSMDLFRRAVDQKMKEDEIMTRYHQVVSGDNCWKISRLYGIPYKTLEEYNPQIVPWPDIFAEYGGEVVFLEPPNQLSLDLAKVKREFILYRKAAEKRIMETEQRIAAADQKIGQQQSLGLAIHDLALKFKT